MTPERQQINDLFIGWYDSPEATTPAHDPGIDAPCIVCAHKLEKPMCTISLALENPEDRKFSFFFRVHKACWDGCTEEEKSSYESAIIDANAP